MIIENIPKEKLNKYKENLLNYIKNACVHTETKYLNLGTKTVRILNHSNEFTPHIEKQLGYILKNSAENFDATIFLWKEKNVKYLFNKIDPTLNSKNLRVRVEMLCSKKDFVDLYVYKDDYSKTNPILSINTSSNIVNFYDEETNTYFYGVENLEPEEFIKEGHIFVKILNKISKTQNTNLIHGALVGLNNKGVLLCARGQRGKSTLSVHSLICGFEYVSDDYFILEKEKNNLFAHPIYSIITLSPEMYNKLYEKLKKCSFVSNNARKDKYVFNISNFHKNFKSKYPVKLCIFPEITNKKEPEIFICSSEEKGRAITQLIHSTLMQMNDLNDKKTIEKLFNMVKNFPFYKFDLCPDIQKNTKILEKFIKNFNPDKKDNEKLEKFIEDITFNLANIIDTENFTIYSMNKFATNIYENLKNGVDKNGILEELHKINNKIPSFENDLNLFYDILCKKKILKISKDKNAKAAINRHFAIENEYKISMLEYQDYKTKELIKEG